MQQYRLLITCFLTFAILLTTHGVSYSLIRSNAINALIGDISYFDRFGLWPDETVSETIRIQTHLEYVETHLRNRKLSHLTSEQQQNRRRLLGILREYRLRGQFPINYTFQKRHPVFIDRHGSLCAVGYLIAQTAGMELARKIDRKYKYAYLEEMADPELAKWVGHSGFTVRELAMIQPGYSYNRGYEIFDILKFVFFFAHILLMPIALMVHDANQTEEIPLNLTQMIVFSTGLALAIGSIVLGFMPGTGTDSIVGNLLNLYMGTTATVSYTGFLTRDWIHPSVTVTSLNLFIPGLSLGYIYMDQWEWWIGVNATQWLAFGLIGLLGATGNQDYLFIGQALFLGAFGFGMIHAPILAAQKHGERSMPDRAQNWNVGYFPVYPDRSAFGVVYQQAF